VAYTNNKNICTHDEFQPLFKLTVLALSIHCCSRRDPFLSTNRQRRNLRPH